MSHPYAFPLHHRNHPTPSSSVSHLSLNNTSTGPQTSPHPQPPAPTGPSPRSDMPEASAAPARISATTPTSTPYVAPERRRRRSSRGLGSGPKRKPSSTKNSLAEAKADPNEPLIPTRTYQFKSFESFDPAPRPPAPLTSSSSASLPTYASSSPSTTSLSVGSGYTFGPPTPFAPQGEPNSVNPGQGGEGADAHAGASTSSGTTPHPQQQQPPKKSKAIFSVGKKVVKEMLGGGGNNTALPPEAKAVYYGRGGAGGAGVRAFKPNPPTAPTANQAPQPQLPLQRSESRQTSSFYTGTGSSSNYTPSSYAESIASSPNATSVDDPDGQSSVYAPSSSGGLVPVGIYSSGHRSVSPLEEETTWRRDSVVSSSGYAESLVGSEWSGSDHSNGYQQQTVWQNPFAGETIQEVERAASVGPLDPRTPFDQMGDQRQVGASSAAGLYHAALRHRPSQPSLLSSYPRQPSITRQVSSGRLTPGYTPATSTAANSATSSAESTPYQPPPQPQPQPQMQPHEGYTSLGGLYPIAAQNLNPNPTPNPERVSSRPLPDPLATAVGQLSLIQNPLNLGWPVPGGQSQVPQAGGVGAGVKQQNPLAMLDPNIVSALYNNNANPQMPPTGLLTPQYTTSPPPQPAQVDLTQSLVYQQALAEQQALAKRLALLERLQREEEAARAGVAQDGSGLFNLGVGGGRGVM